MENFFSGLMFIFKWGGRGNAAVSSADESVRKASESSKEESREIVNKISNEMVSTSKVPFLGFRKPVS